MDVYGLSIDDDDYCRGIHMDLTGYGYKKPTVGVEPETRRPAMVYGGSVFSELSGAALRLLVKVDSKVGLREISVRYPRVLNRIAASWDSPLDAERCFDELLLDARGTRQGFPASVISEIVSLRHHYETHVYLKRIDPWDRAHLR
jgi:hypothetical protein